MACSALQIQVYAAGATTLNGIYSSLDGVIYRNVDSTYFVAPSTWPSIPASGWAIANQLSSVYYFATAAFQPECPTGLTYITTLSSYLPVPTVFDAPIPSVISAPPATPPNTTHKGKEKITIKSTVVTGATSVGRFLICNINGRDVGLPVYQFSYSTPEVDMLLPYTELIIKNASFAPAATSYGVGLGISFYDTICPHSTAASSVAIPMYKLPQTGTTASTLQATNATIVGSLTSRGQYMVIDVDGAAWGVPIYDFSTLYPFNSAIPTGRLSAVDVTTFFEVNPTLYDAPRDAGSTNLNSKIKTYQDLIKRIKMQFGWPIIQIELCDEHIVENIDTAIEWYTKYAGYTEEILAFDSINYQCGYGIRLDRMLTTLYCMSQCNPNLNRKQQLDTELQKSVYDFDLDSYRKVVDVWSFDEANQGSSDYLFSMEYIFAQQTYFSYVLGNYGFDLVTWHILKDWIDTREKMFALKRRYYFDDRNQLLKLYPEPTPADRERFIGVIGCYVEKPIKDLIMERWIYQYASALSKITIGNIRGKFTSVSMFGGGTINYNDLLSQGLEEKKQLEEEIMWKHGEVPSIKFFVG